MTNLKLVLIRLCARCTVLLTISKNSTSAIIVCKDCFGIFRSYAVEKFGMLDAVTVSGNTLQEIQCFELVSSRF